LTFNDIGIYLSKSKKRGYMKSPYTARVIIVNDTGDNQTLVTEQQVEVI
jgi:hypothetical protein